MVCTVWVSLFRRIAQKKREDYNKFTVLSDTLQYEADGP